MSWSKLRKRWTALWSAAGRRVTSLKTSPARQRQARYLRKHCGVSREEAGRRTSDWIKDPGVLDDWNDTRAILDM